jgi:hypothetical protein
MLVGDKFTDRKEMIIKAMYAHQSSENEVNRNSDI